MVVQALSCVPLCDPIDCSTPGFLVLHCLSQFAHTHVHWLSDAIQPSHPLSSPSPPALSLSQYQCLFQWVGSSQSDGQSIGTSASASALPVNIQGWFLLGLINLLAVQSSLVLLSRVWLFAMDYSTPDFPVHHQLSESTIESVRLSNHLIFCHPLLLLSSIFPSIRVFPKESVLNIRWPNYWSFSFSISTSVNIQVWFPLGWTDWTSLHSKSLLQHHSSKASILWCSASFMVQLTHSYMTTKNYSFD